MATQARYDWVDIAKALSITLVVMMYATYSAGEDLGTTGFMHWLVAFATPLRMPEFFVISGLFLSRVIDRNWRAFADRRVVHYLYFFVLWTVILVTLKMAIFAGNLGGALTYLISMPVMPFSAMWFIYALALFSIAIKVLHNFKVPHWAALTIGAGLNLAPFTAANEMQFFFGELADYFVFFYAGYVFAPHIFTVVRAFTAKPLLGSAALVIWALANGALVFNGGFQISPANAEMGIASLQFIRLPLAFTGALAVCIAAGLVSRTFLRVPLTYMGERVLVIYLSFLIPLGIAREIFVRLGMTDTGLLSLAVMISAICGPLVLDYLIKKTGWGNFLFTRPKWASINQQKPSAATASVPAE